MKLRDPSLLASRACIGGVWVEAASGRRFAVTNPANGEIVASVPDMGVAELREAIQQAELARHSWGAHTAKARANCLRRWHDLMVANLEDLAAILTAEMGKPLAEARSEILYGASFVEWFAEEGKRVYGDVIPPHMSDKRILTFRHPVGVVAAITPWNFPNAMMARKIAPALAAGCSVVARPAAETPLSALAMAVLAARAGLPKGLLNIITSTDAAAIGSEMCENPTVRKLSFTGSTEVGRILMRQCASTIKKLSLELGGNAPFIVFGDADIDAAVEGAMACKFRNAGQTCVCANRIYVHDSLYDAFASKLAARAASLKVGDGASEGVTMGPLINADARAKVEAHIADACAKGARILSGGAPHPLGGNFFTPTVMTEANHHMDLAQEETFGPLAPIFRFETPEEVILRANDSISGLAAYFYTRDLSNAWHVAESLEYGIVGVNTGIISTELAPFGGMKQSGLGREGSKYGIEAFLEMKYVCLGI